SLFLPGGGTPALYGRRDVCRYNACAAFSRVTANCANVNWNYHNTIFSMITGTNLGRAGSPSAFAAVLKRRYGATAAARRSSVRQPRRARLVPP
ncbi:MAG: hypothetical protein ABSH15_13735, partial [Verrucomicrobiota bacterium]